MFKCHRVSAKVEPCGGGFQNVTPFVPLRLSAPVRARLIALLFFLFLLISQAQSPGHLHRALVSLHGGGKRLAGRHKVIAKGFSLLCSCASCTTAQTGPF